ncbi:MAG: helix-turn-helix transcriptional regulator [Anaerolineales bacterium]|jgi:transcriptional regulator with XRE-family HTH domain
MTDQQSLSLRSKMLGAMLREARLDSGKSIRESAELLGISPSTMSSYEHGRKAITLPELEVLAYTFDVPVRAFWSQDLPVVDQRPALDAARAIPLRDRMIAVQLKLHRQAAELTQAELAERTGLPASRISAYERGKRGVPLPELEVLAASLGHRVEDYRDMDGPIGRWAKRNLAFDSFAQLSPEIQAFVSEPGNRRFLELALNLSQLPSDRLRSISRALQDVTP